MARLVLLFALLVLPALASAARLKYPFVVRGKVYCDTCRCGFETSATKYIQGARVKIECTERNSLEVVYRVDGETDATGTYKITVEDDHEDQICNAVLDYSPITSCGTKDKGRSKAPVVLTRSNGDISRVTFANAMGFLQDKAEPFCDELLKQYKLTDQGHRISLC
ncbi:hypothetical protein ACFE04_018206 [Oxalis oulophora]